MFSKLFKFLKKNHNKFFIAGFAVNVNFFKDRPKAAMPYKAGYEEDGFLQSLAPFNISEIEFLANECTEVRLNVFYGLVELSLMQIFSYFHRFSCGIHRLRKTTFPSH